MFTSMYSLKPLIENTSTSCILLADNLFYEHTRLFNFIQHKLDNNKKLILNNCNFFDISKGAYIDGEDLTIDKVYNEYYDIILETLHERKIAFSDNELLCVYYYLPFYHMQNYTSKYFQWILDGSSFDMQLVMNRILERTLDTIVKFLEQYDRIKTVYIAVRLNYYFNHYHKYIYLNKLELKYNVKFIDIDI
jgi:hypothetical protein